MAFKKKYGIVILLDALGASEFNDTQIKEFLSARREINEGIMGLTSKDEIKRFGNMGRFHTPIIFTFGDTVVVTIELNSTKYIKGHLFIVSALMKRYLFHSMEAGILFRGCFSIGSYIADDASNTVMGEALTDAARWYEQADWMGLSSTPRTNTILESILNQYSDDGRLMHLKNNGFGYLHNYAVPMKVGDFRQLYVVKWPSSFFDEELLEDVGKEDPERYFLELLSSFKVPRGTEKKYENTKAYFYAIANEIANKSIKTSTDA